MTLPMDQEVHNLALLKSICQRSLRDHWRNSRKALVVNGPARSVWFIRLVLFNQTNEANQTNPITIFLCRWTIVLIKLSRISLFA